MAQFTGTSGDDLLAGDVDDDALLGGEGADSLIGDLGADTLDGGAGTDQLLGGDGDDLLIQVGPATGAETLDGGAGTDTLQVSSTTQVATNPDGTPVYGAMLTTASLSSIERLVFASNAGEGLQATVALGQIGAGKLASDLEVVAGPGRDSFAVVVFGGGDFTMPALRFTDWTYGDGVILVGADGQGGQIFNYTLHANADPSIIQVLVGGAGADTLVGADAADALLGNAGDDRLDGGLGADTLDGGAGTDQLHGGEGDDLLIQVGAVTGAETLDGGAGIDTLQVSSSTLAFTNPDGTPVYGAQLTSASLTSIERLVLASNAGQGLSASVLLNQLGAGKLAPNLELVGGAGRDTFAVVAVGGGDFTMPTLQFTDWNVGDGLVLNGADGAGGQVFNYTLRANNDSTSVQVLVGGGGADTLLGADASDALLGNGGADRLDGGEGSDTLNGGAGADVFELSGGQDRIADFTKGADKFDLSGFGFDGFASLQPHLTEAGGDTVLSIPFGGTTNTTTFVGVTGLTADDFIFPTASVNISGTDAADLLTGTAGADTLAGLAGADTLSGGAGADRLLGGDGDDLLIQVGAVTGAETLDGGAGVDTLQVSSSTLAFTNPDGTPVYGAQLTSASLVSLERLVLASNAGEGLSATVLLNQLGAGKLGPNLEVVGGAGRDTFGVVVVGGGDFTMPTLQFTNWSSGDGLVLNGADGPGGQVFNYTLRANNDSASVQVLVGGGGGDTLVGADANDALLGNAGNDSLDGGAGADTLNGGAGFDTIMAGAGADRVIVSAAAGQLTSVSLGAGADVIELAGSSAGDIVVTDFAAGAGGDRFDLAAFLAAKATGLGAGANPFTTGHLRLVQTGSDTLLQFDANGGANSFVTLATLRNATATQFTAENFGGVAPSVFESTVSLTLTGTAGPDTLDGAAGADTLRGGDGADLLRGAGGADSLAGDLGADTLLGGAGGDTLQGGPGDDLLQGEAGDDLLQHSGQSGADTLQGGDGADTLSANNLIINGAATYGDFAGSTYDGGDGVDYLQIGGPVTFHGQVAHVEGLAFLPAFNTTANGATVAATAASLAMRASAFDFTTVRGTGHVDLEVNAADHEPVNLSGVIFEAGANVTFAVTGSDSADTIVGSSRADDLDGGEGDDVLTGGGAADVFELSGGQDRITDFVKGTDRFDLSDFGFDGFASLQPYLSVVGGDTVLTIPFGGAMHTTTFVGVTGLTAADFVFPTAAVGIGGTDGADLLAGTGVADSLAGGAGADTLLGFGGADTLSGEAGDDLLTPGAGADLVDGGAGLDRLNLLGANGVTVNLGLAAAQNTGAGLKTIQNVEHVTGTAGGDTLVGDGVANWLYGAGGAADSLNGGAGDDLLMVKAGAHTLIGGAGEDAVALRDVAAGVNISLNIVGAQTTGQGTMSLSGVERLSGSSYADSLTGNASANVLAGDEGGDLLNGGAGDDVLLGDGAIDVARPGDGGAITTFDDVAQAFAGKASGADTLIGGLGADTLVGAGGDDVLAGGLGGDRLDGGAGLDIVVYTSATSGVSVDLAAGSATGGDGEDTLSGVERVSGSAFADTLRGDAGANVLLGGDGADTLEARNGNDLLAGEAGGDALDGGAGDDTLQGGAGDDVVTGGDGADQLDGGAGFDRAVFAGASPVTVDLTISAAQDTGRGLDTLVSIEHVAGGSGADRLQGDASGNWLAGGGGDDTLSGGDGDDLIQVGSGANVLSGGAGVDTLSFRDAGGGVSVSLADQGVGRTTLQGVMTFSGFENLSGSEQGDTLTGAAGGSLLAGDLGADSLVGGAGADVLSGDGHMGVPDAAGSGAISLVEAMQGGADTIDAGSGADTVSAGAGADLVLLNTQAGEVASVSLGAGADVLRLDAAMRGGLVVTDFQGGPAGDRLEMADMLSARLTDWDSATENPFETGHLRLVQNGAATVVEFDANGGGDDWSTLMRLENTSSLQLGLQNLGWAPLPMVIGGAGADEFTWDPDSPADTVDGGAGVDIVNVVSPTVLTGTPTIKPSADGSALELDVNGDGHADLTLTGVEEVLLNGERVEISGDLSRTGLAPNTIKYVGTAQDNLLDASAMTSAESVEAQGLDGADTLIGGLADDSLDGGAGDDVLTGAADNDTLIGGAGADTLDGGAGGADVARFSGDSTDYVVTALGGGALQVAGPDGVDRLTGIEVLTFANGSFGQNVAPAGGDSTRTVTAGVGYALTVGDFRFSDSQGDALHEVKIATLPASGELTFDLAPVTAGQVVSVADIEAGRLVFLPGGVGSAALTFQVRDDGVVGWGSNEDATPNTLTFTVPAAPTGGGSGGGVDPGVITSGSSGTAGADVVRLGGAPDHFAAGDGADTVSSGAGDDWVHGNAGADSIAGGGGADTLLGGRDHDLLFGDAEADQLYGDAGDDTVYGGQGDDRIEGGDGANYLRGEDGQDLVLGGSGFDYINGNVGDDTVRGGDGDDWVVGGKDQDQVFGDSGDDILNGNLGADTCVGGDGADVVRGGQGDDVIDGGAGDDWLSGDLGDDTLTGGAGADTFNFSVGAGADRVLDFNVAEGDRVLLAPGQAYTATQVAEDAVVDLGGDRLVLANVQLSSLSDGWIIAA